MKSASRIVELRAGSARTDAVVALLFLLLALALRLPSFYRSVIDWDESLYFLMAEAWRHGHLPYTTLWDNKPIGIYVIFAAFQIVFGDTVESMRGAGLTAVTATAFCLYRLYPFLGGVPRDTTRPAASLAGILYIVCSLQDGGMAANTEIFIAPFVCSSLLIALSRKPGLGHEYLPGLLMGIAVIIKYVAVFEAAAVMILLLIQVPSEQRARRSLASVSMFAAGIVTPMAAALLLYAAAGEADLFIGASLLDNIRRLDMPFSSRLAIHAVSDHAAKLIPLYLAAVAIPIYAVLSVIRRKETAIFAVILTIWIAGEFIGTASAKSFYAHYFLQPLPALCLATVWLLERFLRFQGMRGIFCGAILLAQPAWGAWTAINATLEPVHRDQDGIGWLRDEPARIAAALRPELTDGKTAQLYVFDSEPILYSLTATTPPTRYAFPSFIIARFLSRVAEVDPMTEFNNIIAQHPRFIVCSRLRHPTAARDNMDIYRALEVITRAHYRIWRFYPGAVVYRLQSDPR